MKPSLPPLLLALAALLPNTSIPAERQKPTPLQVEEALEQLESNDWILKWAAMSQLARWHASEAVAPLRKVLNGGDHPWVRGRALVALAQMLGRKVLPEATASAANTAPELRAAAIEALGIIRSPDTKPLIIAAFKDPDPRVRCQAVVAIARLEGKKAWERVAPMLDAREPTIVRYAARALLYVDTPEARSRLVALLDHADARVRAEAATALGNLLPPNAIARLLARMATDGDEKVRSACLKALSAYQPEELVEPMLEALRGNKREYYKPALRILTLRPSRQACDAVARLLAQPPQGFADAIPEALHLLTRLEPDRYLECFKTHLSNRNTRVRRTAIACLERCKGADLFSLLRPLLADSDQGTSVVAFGTLRRATTGAPPGGIVEYLSEVLRGGHPRARRPALELIGQRITPPEVERAITILAPLLASSEEESRLAAANAIAPAADRGARRRIAAAQGYLTRWVLIGPFPRGDRQNKLGPSYFPEHELDLKKTYEPRAWDPTAQFRQLEAPCGGQARNALLLQPPKGARLVVLFRLMLPEADDLKLTAAVGIQDGARPADGVRFRLRADGKPLVEIKLSSPQEGWLPVEADLSPWRGKKVAIELSADPLENPTGDQLLVAQPQLLAGGQKLLSLLELADSAPAWVSKPRPRDKLAWRPYLVDHINGEVPLYDIFPPPIYDRVAYALCDLEVADERKAALEVEADDAFVLWHNGRKLAERASKGKSEVKLTLHPGRNRLVFKVVNYREWWRISARLCDENGRPLRLER